LYSAAISTEGRVVIGGIITTIASFLGVEPNLENQVSGFKRLNQVPFELMNFCKIEARRLYWIYHRDRLLPLSNIDRTTLLHRGNLQWVPDDAEVVQPTPPPLSFTSQARPSSSSHTPHID